jgi:electron transfer flavoprotein-quinone oxidoreductase
MDFAIASGQAAAEAVKAAKASGDFSRAALCSYQTLLKESFVMRDLEAYRKAPKFTETRQLYEAYPAFVTSCASRLFTVDGTPPVHLLSKVLEQVRKKRLSLTGLAIDGWKGARWL